MRIAILLMFFLLPSLALSEEPFAFFGKAKSQEHLPDVEQACADRSICMDVVYRWTIRVDKVISGKLTEKTVKAAMIQHSKYIHAHKHQALFVITRIESEEKRKVVGADYWLEEYAPPSPKVLYCVSDASKYDEIENADHMGRIYGSNCYVRYKQHE
jgi:hypothetical protein